MAKKYNFGFTAEFQKYIKSCIRKGDVLNVGRSEDTILILNSYCLYAFHVMAWDDFLRPLFLRDVPTDGECFSVSGNRSMTVRDIKHHLVGNLDGNGKTDDIKPTAFSCIDKRGHTLRIIANGKTPMFVDERFFNQLDGENWLMHAQPNNAVSPIIAANAATGALMMMLPVRMPNVDTVSAAAAIVAALNKGE